MTKFSVRSSILVGLSVSLLGCGSDDGSGSTPVGTAGTGAAGAVAGAPAGGAGSSAAGAPAAGSPSTGRAGSVAPPAAGSGGTPAPVAGSTVGAAAVGGSGGSAAGSGGSGGQSAAGGGGASGAAAGSDGQGGAGGAGGSGGSAGQPAAGSGGAPGDGGVLNATVVVGSGETFDGQGKRYRAGSALGDGSQDEGQQPMFRIEDGGTLVNVVLGSPAADGIHTYGDATLKNIVWEDIGEDALTIKEPGTVKLDGGSATNGDDKVFQVNAESRFEISNFKASNAGKFIRQNGGTDFKVDVVIDRCDISNMDEAIFRTDSDASTVKMTNTRYSMIGDELFMGVSAGNIEQSNNTEY